MRRFLVIVVVMVAVALLVRAYLPKHEVEQKDLGQAEPPAAAVSSTENFATDAPVAEATSP
jgi:hypothetical protein